MSDTVTLFVGTYSRKEGHVDGQGKGVYAFQFDLLTGALAPLGLQHEVGINPTYLAGTKDTLYAIQECDEPLASDASSLTGYVSALRIDNGKLTLLNRLETRGTFPCHVSVNADQDFVAVSNYGGGSVALYPINADGSLAELSDLHQFEGASLAVPDRQEAPHLHSSSWAPNGNYLFGADLGNDRVAQFVVDKATKKLVPNPNGAFAVRPTGSGPRHLAIHAPLNVAYVADELSNTVGVHKYDAATGTLSSEAIQNISTLPSDYTGAGSCADIHIAGDFVYVSTRFHDHLAIYRINSEDDGKLSLVGFESTRGKVPRNFLVFRNFLLVANQDTDNIEVFHIDTVNGKLVFTGTSAACPTPVSLFIPPQ
jgi:6-phosphogluconolactonase (cycloisomerase 2 family)|uniref:6-phosphogluconolactonase n=1 Tax=Globisporangium ultimum (strain ATCC 200006 / CBS 805.95 / DAOM BR144) TaxID=431595 RepID=K3WIQ9_GLOUD